MRIDKVDAFVQDDRHIVLRDLLLFQGRAAVGGSLIERVSPSGRLVGSWCSDVQGAATPGIHNYNRNSSASGNRSFLFPQHYNVVNRLIFMAEF